MFDDQQKQTELFDDIKHQRLCNCFTQQCQLYFMNLLGYE